MIGETSGLLGGRWAGALMTMMGEHAKKLRKRLPDGNERH